MLPIKVLNDREYFADVVQEVERTKTGDRIGLATMALDVREEHVGKLMVALIAAAARGVNVYLLVDANSFMMDAQGRPNGPLLRGQGLIDGRQSEYQAKYTALRKLAEAGGNYRVINLPRSRFTLPVAGRSHIKTTIINDIAYLGGCNLCGSMQIDYMVKFRDTKAVNWLFKLIVQSYESGSIRQVLNSTDRQIQLDSHTSLLVDAGKPGQSLILQQALELIDQAKESILITCQFFPNSITATHLDQARRRGVKVEVFYNHPIHQTKFLGKVQQAVLIRERLWVHKDLFAHQLPREHRRIHAKVIATEKGAMVGSHNYVALGVRLGTAEIALRRDDPAFSRDVLAAVMPHLKY